MMIYNVPEGEEGLSVEKFVEKLLINTLEIPLTTELDTEITSLTRSKTQQG